MQHDPWKHISLEELFPEDGFTFVSVWIVFLADPVGTSWTWNSPRSGKLVFFLKGVFSSQRFPPTLVKQDFHRFSDKHHSKLFYLSQFLSFHIAPKPESSSILGIFPFFKPPCKGLTDPAEIPSVFRNAHLCEGRRKGPETPEGLAWREGGVANVFTYLYVHHVVISVLI